LGRVGLEVTDDTLAVQRTRLVEEGDSVGEEIRGQQAGFSSRLDRIYADQAELTGSLYDLIDRYLFWRAERVTDTTVVIPPDPDLEDLQARKRELARSFTVPRVNSITAGIRNRGYWTERRFSWSGWHPGGSRSTGGGSGGPEGPGGIRGIGVEAALEGLVGGGYEFSFIDRPGTAGALARTPELEDVQFLSNGGVGSLTLYSFLEGPPARVVSP
ncbi:MAG: hypothetical protein GWM92_02515, partial [Gemmatimonadetes bacterium]|nr:hypothetical protein [Gemmatimonadota bacterium]NIR80089.1 hypothetical protein [Gemmatimonadota bacterium]NIT85887.1 hypothetical protein [Gemmatimonadota bacterium]NIU33772.1 hypothetical protein [Gemmatimonadota bacterium]NIU37084.1 hypothetical protein [Gemmatimonadota bacterium]